MRESSAVPTSIDFTEAELGRRPGREIYKAVFFLSAGGGASHGFRTVAAKIIDVSRRSMSFRAAFACLPTPPACGIAGLGRLRANEWASQGINVNAIAPGYFATNNTAALQADPKRNSENPRANYPRRRWVIRRIWVVPACSWLRAHRTRLHGVILPVDGGWLAR